ncbi:MAG: alpha/beta fold hydrolase [Pseudomonadota bacterium]
MIAVLRLPLVLLFAALLSACAASTTSAGNDPISSDPVSIDPENPPAFHELTIPSNGARLTGFMLSANGAGPHPTAILLHGYPGNEKNLDLAQSLRRAGFNVLFFHYRGAWGSTGSYKLSYLSEDVAAVLTFLKGQGHTMRVDTTRLSVVGHSMGGFAALRAGSREAGLDCVVGLAAANLGAYADLSGSDAKDFSRYTDGLFMLQNFDGQKALREIRANAERFDVRYYGPGLSGKSVLLVAGANDTVITPDIHQGMVDAFLETPGIALTAETLPGDHAFSSSRIQLQRTVINWMNKNCR